MAIAEMAGSPESGMAVFIGFATANFLIELLTNGLLSPIIVRLLKINKKLNG